MKRIVDSLRIVLPKMTSPVMTMVMVWALVSAGSGTGSVLASGSGPGSGSWAGSGVNAPTPALLCPGGQCFTDVTAANPFYAYINSLYQDNIIAGYACGGTNEPCDAAHRPYYRPGNNVTRGQMSKFVDNGRRNIADAVGLSLNLSNGLGVTGATTITGSTTISSTGTALNVTGATIITGPVTIGPVIIDHSIYISTTAGIAGDFETRSGGEGMYSECLQSGNNCYALEGYAPTGDYAGYMYGGKGVYAESDDAAQPGLDGNAYGNNSYGVSGESQTYRGGYFKSDSNVLYSLYVDDKDGPTQGTAALNVHGTIRGEGNLVIAGSKAGYIVDIMQNVDSTNLETGDVVTIMGNSPAVLGQNPVVTVKKADTAYDTGVVGIVDQVMYVPDAATKAAYDKQQADWNAAMDQRNQAMAAANAAKTKPDLSSIVIPDMTITDAQGTLHDIPGATQVAQGGYAGVVTLGSYKGVKVDASFGPIHAGDLLVASPHAGYAMKATTARLPLAPLSARPWAISKREQALCL